MKAATPLRRRPCRVLRRPIERCLEGSDGLDQTPVVCAPLHSMIGPIAAGAKRAGDARVVYVMTDGAALPGAFSRLAFELRDAGLVDGWITCGQAFGGELEAVTVWTAMLAAKEVLGADVIVVADGPGNLGTDTTWGVSALASGNALNAVAALGGRPIPSLRISFADRVIGTEASRTIRSRSFATSASCPRTCRSRARDDEQRDAVGEAVHGAELEDAISSWRSTAAPRSASSRAAASNLARWAGVWTTIPCFFLAAGAAGVLAGRCRGQPPVAGGSATTRPSRDRPLCLSEIRSPMRWPITDQIQVADPRPDQAPTRCR